MVDDTLLHFLCCNSTICTVFFFFLANKAETYEDSVSLYPHSLRIITLCYTTPFNLADGHFPVHHPSSPLPSLSPFSPALLCTPLVSHLCPVCPHPTHHPFNCHLPPLSAPCSALCVNVNFTLLMFLASVTVCFSRATNLPVQLIPSKFTWTLHMVLCKIEKKKLIEMCFPISPTMLRQIISLPLRWGAICGDISWLHGPGLCHLSHSR